MGDRLDPLLTVSEVASLCKLKPASIYSAVTRNLIPAVVLWKGKRRRVVRFRQSDLEQFIQQRSLRTKA